MKCFLLGAARQGQGEKGTGGYQLFSVGQANSGGLGGGGLVQCNEKVTQDWMGIAATSGACGF